VDFSAGVVGSVKSCQLPQIPKVWQPSKPDDVSPKCELAPAAGIEREEKADASATPRHTPPAPLKPPTARPEHEHNHVLPEILAPAATNPKVPNRT